MAGGCGGDDESGVAGELPAAPVGVFSGRFPCGNCPGIETTLWVRPDGRFLLEQLYLQDEAGETMRAYNMGRWEWAGADRTIVLDGSGPQRSFTGADSDTLLMQTRSDLEHRLSRHAAAPQFTATVRMSGVIRLSGGSASFRECLTGYDLPVTRGGDYRRFLHQYRGADTSRGTVPVAFNGRFAWTQAGEPLSVTIEEFVTFREGSGC